MFKVLLLLCFAFVACEPQLNLTINFDHIPPEDIAAFEAKYPHIKVKIENQYLWGYLSSAGILALIRGYLEKDDYPIHVIDLDWIWTFRNEFLLVES